MLFFVEALSGDAQSGYQAHAMDVDGAPPFDVSGEDDGFALWCLAQPRRTVRYRSNGPDGIVTTGSIWSSYKTWIRRNVEEAAGAFGTLVLESDGPTLAAPLFLSSHVDSSPSRYTLEVTLCFQRLSDLPDVRRSIAFARQVLAQFCKPVLDESVVFASHEYCASMEECAAKTNPEAGLMIPCHIEGRQDLSGALHLTQQLGENRFVAVAYIQNGSEDICAGAPMRRVTTWEEHDETKVADQLICIVDRVIDASGL